MYLKLWNGNYATDRANEITKFQYRSKTTGTETWGDWIDITDKFKTAVTGQSIDNIHLDLSSKFSIHENGTSGGFTTNTEFDIQFAVSDGVGTAIFNTDYEVAVLDAGNYLDTYMKSGNGYKYAVNGVVDPNLKNGLQVNGSLYLNGQEINSILRIKHVSGLSIKHGATITDEVIKRAEQITLYYTMNDSNYRHSMNVQKGDTEWYIDAYENFTIFFRVYWADGVIATSAYDTDNAQIIGYDLLYT